MDDINFDTTMDQDFSKIIFTKQDIALRVKEIGQQVTRDFKDKQSDGIVVLSVLKGAAIFMADLIREIDLKFQIDFLCASSYGNCSKSSGKVSIKQDLTVDVTGKHVIIAEDIVETGLTLSCLCDHLKEKGALSVSIVAFLNKHLSKKIDVEYCCFDCPDKFIVGYGLDYKQYYRNMPYISSL